ncbi:MAG: SDR family NAD(P)-dependent oxidoreductase [Eggerthellaceae bacterium]
MLCDGTKADMVQAMIDKTLENSAASTSSSPPPVSPARMNSIDVTEAGWDKIFAVNLKANFFLATAVARVMKDNPDGGKMVIISSQRGISAMENIAPYSITKAAVMGWSARWRSTSPSSASGQRHRSRLCRPRWWKRCSPTTRPSRVRVQPHASKVKMALCRKWPRPSTSSALLLPPTPPVRR